MDNSAKKEPLVYTIREVSQMLHTSPGFIYELIWLGLLPALKLGSLRVRKESLDEFLSRYDGYDLSDPKYQGTGWHRMICRALAVRQRPSLL